MAIALVSGQTATTDFLSSNTPVVTLPNNPTTGNFVVVLLAMGSGAATVTSIKDSNNNSYVATSKSLPFAGNGQTVAIYYLENAPANASKTINLTLTGAPAGDVWAFEFSGVAISSSFENDATASTAATNPVITPSYTTLNNGDLLVATMGTGGTISGASASWIAGSGIPTAEGEGGAYIIQGTAGAQAVSFTASATGLGAGIIAAFKANTGTNITVPVGSLDTQEKLVFAHASTGLEIPIYLYPPP